MRIITQHDMCRYVDYNVYDIVLYSSKCYYNMRIFIMKHAHVYCIQYVNIYSKNDGLTAAAVVGGARSVT